MYKLTDSVALGSVLKLAGIMITIPPLLLLYYAFKVFLSSFSSPLLKLQCPPGGRLLSGHMLMFVGGRSYETLLGWREKYGHVFAFRAVLGQRRCVTTDTTAIAYILANNQKYYKPEAARWNLSQLLGNGMVTAEGSEHRHQRRAINPAFSSMALKSIVPTFLSKSEQLCDMLRQQLGTTSSTQVDMLHWSSRAALDIISLAGFNYDLDTLHQGVDGSELASALHRVNNPKSFPLFVFFKIFIPPLRIIRFDRQSKETQRTRNILRHIGVNMIQEKQRELELEKATGGGLNSGQAGSETDLLSSMVRFNMPTKSSENEALSMEEMLQQVPTFLVAGHETTANTVAWALFSLSEKPTIQTRLRDEIRAAFPENSAPSTLEDLNALSYLEAVVRETLRFHATVELVTRVAEEDDVVPLDKGYTGRDGNFHQSLRLKKGDHIMIPILLMNRMKEFWGEDADEFNPERWLKDLPGASNAIPGLWANIMTFSGGPRSCIGYKFAILEMKALLFHLVKSFIFELAVDPSEIVRNELIVTRPLVRSQKEQGAQLPMIIRPATLA